MARDFPELTDLKFVSEFMSILETGAKDSTYKFAFARFLLDYSREHDSSTVSFSTIAEYFLRYYWVQECRSKLNQTSRKIMKKPNESKEKEFLMKKIIQKEFGDDYYPEDFEKIKEKEPQKIKNFIQQIEINCFNDVTYAFQNTDGGFQNRPFFDYKIKRMKKRFDRLVDLPIIDLQNGITLNPKAMNFFKRYYVILEKSIILEWARFIEQFNLGVPELIRKIEGKKEERKPTTRERVALEKAGFTKCFYCNDDFNDNEKSHVEHVIPFSYIYQNEMWNFVLACQDCNCEKKGKLPSKCYLDSLIKRNKKYREQIPELDRSLSKLGKDFEKAIRDHYDNAESHGFKTFTNFSKLYPNFY